VSPGAGISTRKQFEQGPVDVVVAAPGSQFFQHTIGSQHVEVLRGCKAGHAQVTAQEIHPRARMVEQVVDQVVAVELAFATNALLGLLQQGLDSLYRGQCLGCSGFHRLQHVQHPILPVVVIAHALQQAVVVRLGADDVTAQVQHRNIQQAFLDQVEHVDDAPGTAIAVVERVDAFKLVMDERHLHQGVGCIGRIVMDEAFQFPHQFPHFVGILRRLMHHAPATVPQGSAGQAAQPA